MPRPRARLVAILAVLLLVTLAALSRDGVRWRARVIALRASGKVPDLGWLELLGMLGPGSRIGLKPLLWTRNPHRAIVNPDTSAADLEAGRRAFRSRCSRCHGPDGSGGPAPALVGRPLGHGSSDWALYRAISRGFPGTGMPRPEVPAQERWRIAAFLRSLRRQLDSQPGGDPTVPASAMPSLPVTAPALRAARSDSGNWLTYSGAYDGWRYSPLAQINRGNVANLRLLWIHQVSGPDPRFETTPLVVDGIMFLTTPTNGVRALNAETGALLWEYQRALRNDLRRCCGRVNRGLAILGATLYLATLDARLVALDAATGRVRWERVVADPRDGYSLTAAPLAANGLVLIGSAGGEYPTRGFIDAYDAETGRRRWRFYCIPGPGVAGNESWSGDSWKTGGAPAWMTGSYDPALNLIYWGTGNPNPDYNGDRRLGDNLYSNSLVALDLDTGTLRWYFQFTPHDVHDWDATQIPVLVDRDGLPGGRLLLTANKNGFYYVLDRVSGRFLHAREFARQTWALGIDSTGRPLVRPESAPSAAGTPVFPSSRGATNWWSPSYSPRTRWFYVPSYEREDLFFKGELPPVGSGSRPVPPGRARVIIRALDPLTGERRWEHETYSGTGTGLELVGGLLSTGGDLLFGAGGNLVLALDASSGRRLWSFSAGAGIHAAAVSYLVRGRQRISIAAGNALLTFGLD